MVYYLSCAVNNVVNALTKGSIVMYRKRAYPLELDKQLAQILLDESDQRLIMYQYVALTVTGNLKPSL